MRLYLDTCCLQRLFDDDLQPRVAAETESLIAILDECEQGRQILLSSTILEMEIARCPFPDRREGVEAILSLSAEFVRWDAAIQQRASVLTSFGLQGADASHLASAESGMADCFCTCDDRLLRKARSLTNLTTRILSPLQLALKVFA